MSLLFFVTAILVCLVLASPINGQETHTVHFENHCGHGKPTLIIGGEIVSTGEDYVSNGQISAAIAYLQTGDCGFNGDRCPLLETTLTDSQWGSFTDISLIPPHELTIPVAFEYYGSCTESASCSMSQAGNCPMAFYGPNDYWAQVACPKPNANLKITFCEAPAKARRHPRDFDSNDLDA